MRAETAMDLGLTGKTVLITGGSRGIGRAAAETLAAEGCHLVLVARGPADLEVARAAIIRTANVRVDVVAADLSASAEVGRLAARFPDIDILVNNAGAIPGGDLIEIDEPTWRTAWDLKVFGYINMCRAFYALMTARGAGVIINVIGTGALSRDPDYICGATGNAALVAFTQSLGSVSVRAGVRVVGINPGPVATERLVTLYRKKAQTLGLDPDSWRDLIKPMPFARAATPQEIAAAIAFLASEQSSYTSGSVIAIDAGAAARSS
jgi:3-oxoacyl-[acyl-carrier protein] reductase